MTSKLKKSKRKTYDRELDITKANEKLAEMTERQIKSSKFQSLAQKKQDKSKKGGSFLKELTISLICLFSQSHQQTAPSIIPTVTRLILSTESVWSFPTANIVHLSVGMGSRIGNTSKIIYTSLGANTLTTGKVMTIFDPVATGPAPTIGLSGDATNLKVLYSSGGAVHGSLSTEEFDGTSTVTFMTKFALIVQGASVPDIKIYEANQLDGQFSKDITSFNAQANAIYFIEQENTIIVAANGGVHIIDTDADTTTAVTAFTGDNFKYITKDITSRASTIMFTAGVLQKKLYTFDYSTGAGATIASTVTSTYPPNGFAQSSLNPAKVIMGVDYFTGSKNFQYIEDYATDAITETYVFTPNSGQSIGLRSIWNLPQTDIFYIAVGFKVFVVDVSSNRIITSDVTSSFLTGNQQVLTSLTFYEDDLTTKYFIAAGYEQNSYAFLKKMTYIDSCDSSCATCSIAQDAKRCLTCPTTAGSTNFFYQNDPTINNIYCLTASECEGVDGFFKDETNINDKKCISSSTCIDTLSKRIVRETSDCVSACTGDNNYMFGDDECISKVACQNKFDYYAQTSTFTCVTPTTCFGDGHFVLESTSECLEECPDAAVTDVDTEMWSYETTTERICKSARQCRVQGASYTYHNVDSGVKKCILSSDCDTDGNFIIEDLGMCVGDCAEAETLTGDDHRYSYEGEGSAGFGSGLNYCISTYQCQSILQYWTRNSTTPKECVATCATSSLYKINTWHDCLDACPTTEPGATHTWVDDSAGAADLSCLTKKQCSAKDFYTKSSSAGTPHGDCIEAATCEGAGFRIEDTMTCVTACTGDYDVQDTEDNSGETALKKCISESECISRDDGYVLAGTPKKCILKKFCKQQSGDTHAIDEGTRTCVTDCSVLSKYLSEGSQAGDEYPNYCFTEGECKNDVPIKKYVDYENDLCVSEDECCDAPKSYRLIESNRTCISACGITVGDRDFSVYKYVGEKTGEAVSHCLSREQCMTLPEIADEYSYPFYDGSTYECLNKVTCLAKGAMIIRDHVEESGIGSDGTEVGLKMCVKLCSTTIGNTIDFLNVNYTYYDANVDFDGDGTDDNSALAPTGVTGIFKEKCITAEYCVQDGRYLEETNKICYTREQCYADSMKKIYKADSTCVSSCPDGTYVLAHPATGTTTYLECVTPQQCSDGVNEGETDPRENIILKDTTITGPPATDMNHCVTRTFCTTTQTSFIIEDRNECVAACMGAGIDHVYSYKDATDFKCYSKEQCRNHKDGSDVLDRYFDESSATEFLCKTLALCTTKIIKSQRQCVATCSAADSPGYIYQLQENADSTTEDDTVYCVSKNECLIDSEFGYVSEGLTNELCFSEAGCNTYTGPSSGFTDGFLITDDHLCLSACPTDQYAYHDDSSPVVKKCVTKQECLALLDTNSNPHVIVESSHSTKADFCVSYTTCSGSGTDDLGINVVVALSTCVTSCPTGHDYHDYTNKKCYSLDECQRFDSFPTLAGPYTTVTMYADKTNMLCETRDECIADVAAEAMYTGSPAITARFSIMAERECLAACTGDYPYLELPADTANNCLNATLCGGDDQRYTFDGETPKLCLDVAGCQGKSSYVSEETSSCAPTCPNAGEYQFIKTASAWYCITAEECQNVVDYATDNTTMACLPHSGCPDDGYIVYDWNDCVRNCKDHPTHTFKYMSSGAKKMCLTSEQCQTMPLFFTYNYRLINGGADDENECITQTECLAKNTDAAYIITYNSDCVHACTSLPEDKDVLGLDELPTGDALADATRLYAEETAPKKCLTAIDCQSLNDRFTKADSNQCISKSDCNTANFFVVETTNECVGRCSTEADNDFRYEYRLNDVKECISIETCNARDDYYTYNVTTPPLCLLDSVCKNSYNGLPDPNTQDCGETCSKGLFKYSLDRTCLTAQACALNTDFFADRITDECISKSDCQGESRLTMEGNPFCLESCPEGYYIFEAEFTCKTAEECKAQGSYTFNKTDTVEAKCIDEATCVAEGRSTHQTDYYWDCACPADSTDPSTPYLKYYWDYETRQCVSNIECTSMTNRYTHNTTKSCIKLEECQGMGLYTIGLWKDCLSSCSLAESLDHTLLRVETSTCVTQAMCEADAAPAYVDSTNNKCLTKAECTAQDYFTVSGLQICTETCADQTPKDFTDSINNICYGDVECQGLTDRFSKNDTNQCLSQTQCTSFDYKMIEEWSDCIVACPISPGSHEFLDDITAKCLLDNQCTAIGYTKNDTRNCVSQEICEHIAYKTIDLIKDCVATCAGHPSHNYLLESQDICVSAKECEAMTDRYTHNVTSKCITDVECLGLSFKLLTNYDDCIEECPALGYFIKDDQMCLTKEECTAENYYSNLYNQKCEASCPAPYYHDVQGLSCLTACPSGYLRVDSARNCYSPQECRALSSDHWIYPDEGICQVGCNRFKQLATRECVASTNCPHDVSLEDSTCFFEVQVNPANVAVHNAAIDSGSTPVNTVERSDVTTILLELNVNLANLNDIIESIEYNVVEVFDASARRLLQETAVIDDYVFAPGPNPGEYQVSFVPPSDSRVDTRIKFKDNIEVYQQSGSDPYPTLYKINIPDMLFTIPAVPKENKFTVSEAITMIIDACLKIIPASGNMINMITSTRILTFFSQDYNRIVAYNRASSLNIENESMRDLYNQTFIDWGSSLNTVVIKLFSEETIIEDVRRTCTEDIQSKACYSRYPSNLILTKSLFGLAMLILFLFSGYRRIALGVLPTFWIGSQLLVLLDLAYNLSSSQFKSNFQAAGLAATWALSALVLGKFFFLVLNRDTITSDKKHDMHKNVFYEIFSSRRKMGEYFMIRFVLDFTIAVCVAFLRDYPKILGGLLLIIEFITFGTSFLGHFQRSVLKIRAIVINSVFLVLSLMNLILSLTGSSTSPIFGILAYSVSWIIIVLEIVFVVASFNTLKYKKDISYLKKKEKKAEVKGKSYMVADDESDNKVPAINRMNRAPAKKMGGTSKRILSNRSKLDFNGTKTQKSGIMSNRSGFNVKPRMGRGDKGDSKPADLSKIPKPSILDHSSKKDSSGLGLNSDGPGINEPVESKFSMMRKLSKSKIMDEEEE